MIAAQKRLLLLLAVSRLLCHCQDAVAEEQACEERTSLLQSSRSEVARSPLRPSALSSKSAFVQGETTLPPKVNVTGDKDGDGVVDVGEMTGVSSNKAGDLDAFVSGVLTNGMIIAVVIFIFSCLRLRYPLIYSNNAVAGITPLQPSQTFCGWLSGSLALSTDDAAECAGLDAALELEFMQVCMRILATIGLPMLCVMGPLHYFFGGNEAGKIHDDLSRIAMGNVSNKHPWLYYLEGMIVWAVCVVVKTSVYDAQGKFLQRRFHWLKKMSAPRSTTVLVQGIPEDYRSDEKVREFFSKALTPQSVKEVFVVKHAEQLESLALARDQAKGSKYQAELQLGKDGKRPTHRLGFMRESVDSINQYSADLARIDELMLNERDRIRQECSVVGGINSRTAFVTFHQRRDAEIAKELDYTPDLDEWVVGVAPEPSSVRWSDLRTNDAAATVEEVVGLGCVAGLYVGFMPVCLAITNVAYNINMGPLQPMWSALAPTIGLTVFLSFLPTVLMLVFNTFFTLNTSPEAQHKLQVWYFWFQFVFVILVTAIGSNFLDFCSRVSQSPLSFPSLLADQMPGATHFYMNYLVTQLSVHCKELLRYVPLSKFLGFRTLYSEEEARKMAEPEDQDYYGRGSRSARSEIIMVIGIVFSTLSPAVPLLALLNFACMRLAYGYLIVFAETKKPDLGGQFWVTSLRHVMNGTVLYSILMTGVLLKRSPNFVPGAIALSSLPYMVYYLHHFESKFRWQTMPYVEIMQDKDALTSGGDTGETYEQPELRLESLEASVSKK